MTGIQKIASDIHFEDFCHSTLCIEVSGVLKIKGEKIIMATYTPRKITPKIIELCNEINYGVSPVRVPVRTMSKAVPNDCFPNVKNKINEFGGEIQYGWCIWEWANVMIEAELHAVWRSPEGRLICVSPHENDNEILFLMDNSKTFNGVDRVDNIRKSLRDESVVEEFITVCQELYFEREKLTKGRFGEVKFEVTPELRTIAKRHQFLLEIINRLPSLPKPNNYCSCKSGKKYKNCCQLINNQ